MFEFGKGLSYKALEAGVLALSGRIVMVKTNTGHAGIIKRVIKESPGLGLMAQICDLSTQEAEAGE